MKYNPYSISKFGSYSSCPMKFKFHYIDKIIFNGPAGLPLQKGNFIHAIIEENYNYNTKKDTNEIFTSEEKQKAINIVKNFEKSELGIYYKRIADDNDIYSKHEEKFGFLIKNKAIELCSWSDPECWIRGALDFQFNILPEIHYNIDWKSGKDKSKDDLFGIEQSTAYSIFLFLKHSNVNTVISKFVFVEHGTEKTIVYTRDKLSEYIKMFYEMTKVVEKTEIFKENISQLCLFCDFHNHGYCSKYIENEEKTNNFLGVKVALDF